LNHKLNNNTTDTAALDQLLSEGH